MNNSMKIRVSAAVCSFDGNLKILDSKELGVNKIPSKIEEKNLSSNNLPGEDELLTW